MQVYILDDRSISTLWEQKPLQYYLEWSHGGNYQPFVNRDAYHIHYFAQWHYHSQWGPTETWLLLVERQQISHVSRLLAIFLSLILVILLFPIKHIIAKLCFTKLDNIQKTRHNRKYNSMEIWFDENIFPWNYVSIELRRTATCLC